MFKASINTNHITVTNPNNETITSGSVNVNFIQFLFSEDWRGLKKTVLFQTKKVSIPIILEGDGLLYTMPIPWETLVYANESINVGAYGTRMDDKDTLEDEEVVLPTVWGTIPERIRQGVVITDPTPTSPTYDAYQFLLKTIEDLIANGGSGGGNGTPGVSPTITVTETDDGVSLTITDINGNKTVTIKNGKDGANGLDGTDGVNGVSPTVSIEEITGGNRLTITDVNGAHSFDIFNGMNGSTSESDFPTFRGWFLDNISFFDNIELPCCVRLVQTVLGYSFNDDIVYVARNYDSIIVTTVDNVTMTFSIDPDTGKLSHESSKRLDVRLDYIEETIEELRITGGKEGPKGDTGPQGPKGEPGEKGDKGDQGETPYIGENGNWWIGDTDTGVSATGSGSGNGDVIMPVRAPIGVIVWWSGTSDNIPTGWHICDGTDGTIDLQDKFILASGVSHETGDTGGSEEVTLTTEQLPKHAHTVTKIYGPQAAINTTTARDSHVLEARTGGLINGVLTAYVGSSQSHPNMPPYYTLCAIQKISSDDTDGPIFTPSVSEEGVLSWTNNGNLENPEPVNIRGPEGTAGNNVTINGQNVLEIVAGENISIEQEDNTLTISATGGESSGEVYSTEETRIGTWIDGKPLYRRVITGLVFSLNDDKTYPNYGKTALKIDTTVNLSATVITLSGEVMSLPLQSYTETGSFNTSDQIKLTDSALLTMNRSTYPSSKWSDVTATAILEYTKTTDQATKILNEEVAE